MKIIATTASQFNLKLTRYETSSYLLCYIAPQASEKSTDETAEDQQAENDSNAAPEDKPDTTVQD